MFGALVEDFKLFSAAVCALVICRRFCRLRDRFKSKFGALRLYKFFSVLMSVLLVAALAFPNGTKIMPVTTIAQTKKALASLIKISFLVSFKLLFISQSPVKYALRKLMVR